MVVMKHAILARYSSQLSYFLLSLCVNLDDIHVLCMIVYCMTSLIPCDCMSCLSVWAAYLPPYLQPFGFGHFLHFSSYICKCEALCVLVSLTELEARSRI